MHGAVLVTGGQGFAGQHLLAELGNRAAAPDLDVTEQDAVVREIRETRPDAVVHLAALSQVSYSWREPATVWHVNVLGVVNVLEAVRSEAPTARVLVVSTGEVYGRALVTPTPETEPVAPVSPYAASKAAAEIAASWARVAGLDVVVARAFQDEVPGRDDRFAVGSWATQLALLEREGGGTLRVGNLDAERDVTDVRDVCRAYRLLLDRTVPADVYNVASGRTRAMRRVLELLLELVDCEVTVEPDPALLRPLDLPVVAGDATKLRAATGWEPAIPLEQTLADTLDAARAVVRHGRMPTP